MWEIIGSKIMCVKIFKFLLHLMQLYKLIRIFQIGLDLLKINIKKLHSVFVQNDLKCDNDYIQIHGKEPWQIQLQESQITHLIVDSSMKFYVTSL